MRKYETNIFYKTIARINARISLHHFVNVIDKYLIWYKPKKKFISKKVRLLIMQQHRSNNQQLDEEFELGLKELNYY